MRIFLNNKPRANFYETLFPFLEVPDEYSFTMRAVGLYPLMAIPVVITTDISRKKIRSWYDMNLEKLPVDGRLKAFAPVESSPLTENEIQAILDASREIPWVFHCRMKTRGKSWSSTLRLFSFRTLLLLMTR